MASIKLDIWSLCPFRSPVAIEERSALVNPHTNTSDKGPTPPQEVRQSLGPCLGPGCGLYKITKVENGQVKEGMCGIRFIGEVFNSIAGSLETLVQLQVKAGAAQGSGAIFGGDGKTAPPSV